MAPFRTETPAPLSVRGRIPASRPARKPALRRALTLGLAATSLLLASAPRPASAALPDDRVDFSMYGRVGIAWTLNGQVITGKPMNLTSQKAIGGRFEEGDYLEPTATAHIVKPAEGDKNGLAIDMALTFAMFARNGSFIDTFTSNTPTALGIELFNAYIEARNVFTPDLTFWGGARQYRGTDVHIADYFYFNDLSSQGGGVKYKGLDAAVLLQTSGTGDFYNADSDGDGTPDVQRQRTVFVAQYKHAFGETGHTLQGLAELHVLPSARKGRGPELAPGDHGMVIGAKLHLDLGNGGFNDVALRYGGRIANGATGGSQTWYTFGLPDDNGTFEGAYGLSAVEHFLWNFGKTLTLNAYGVLNVDKGGHEDVADKRIDFGVGARSTLYAHDNFHLVNEATFQGRKDGDLDMGTAVKLSIVPTIVPTGERTMWARPHLRLIYTAGFYNKAAVDQLMSSYLKVVGPTRTAHFIGARTEWWF